MITILIALTFITAILAFFEDYIKPEIKFSIFISLGLALILLAGFKDIYAVNDAENYEYTYQHFDDPYLAKGIEYSYLIFSKLLNKLSSDAHYIFILYAIIGITIKFIAIKLNTPNILFLSLIVYLSNFYILHELTQIRAGVASGCSLLVIYFTAKNNLKYALLTICIALFFHYSSLVLIVIPFIYKGYLNKTKRWILLGLIPVGYIMHFVGMDISTLMCSLPVVGDKISLYKEMQDLGIAGDEINVFNMTFLIKIAIFLYLIIFYDTIYLFNERITLYLEVQIISILSFLMLSSFPVLAFRVSELFGVVEILLTPMIGYTIKQKSIGKLIPITISVAILFLNIFYLKLII